MCFLAGVLKKKPTIKVASFSNHLFDENEESISRVYP